MSDARTNVTIGGRQYTLRGESAERTQRVAAALNSRFDALRASHPAMANADLALLTALNVMDDYLTLADENAALTKELNKARKAASGSRTSRSSAAKSASAKAAAEKKQV